MKLYVLSLSLKPKHFYVLYVSMSNNVSMSKHEKW